MVDTDQEWASASDKEVAMARTEEVEGRDLELGLDRVVATVRMEEGMVKVLVSDKEADMADSVAMVPVSVSVLVRAPDTADVNP